MSAAVAVEEKEIQEKALALPEQAKGIKVTDDVTLKQADDFLTQIKEVRKELAEYYDPEIKQAHQLHKNLLAKKKDAEAPLIEAESHLKPQIANYMAEQECKRKEEEDRLRRQREKEEEERRLQAAIEAEEAGEAEAAEALLEEQTYVPPAPAPRATPKLNSTISQRWKWGITNEAQIPREYLKIDEVKLNKVVTALKGNTQIPGIRVYPESTVSGKSTRR